MTAEIITIGDEILTGHTVNTNAAFIGEKLTEIDVRVLRETTIGDDISTIAAIFRQAIRRSEIIIATGGLGPTHDDVTKRAIANAFNRPLVMHGETLEVLKAWFAARRRTLDKINEEQALLPVDADFVPNPVGTAVGIHIAEGGWHFYVLPGVPDEMRPMITNHIVPFLKTRVQSTRAHGALYTTGIPESKLYAMLEPVLDTHPEVKVAFLPGYNGVKIRFSCSRITSESSQKMIDAWRADAKAVLGNAIYSETEDSIETVIGELLRAKGATLAIAESCTAGIIASRITDIAGSSEYFTRGYVTYSNDAKIELLGVDPHAIDTEGAVSETVAKQMADGARKNSKAAYAVAVTGIAGPGGGTPEKPVGLTYVAVSGGGETICRKHLLGMDRSINRRRASQVALNLLRKRLIGEK